MIVEDEQPILDLMKRLVEQHPLLELAGAFTSATEALYAFEALKLDAAFLDIEMPRVGGIELAEKLRAVDDNLQIVFTTAYTEYAIEAFRVSAVDYLVKPVAADEIERVVARLAKNHSRRKERSTIQAEELFVRCMGTFETRGLDGSLIKWPTRKTEELFAYFLVYPNRLAGKWQLADLLWPDLEEERALHNVHNSVYRLKKALKEASIAIDLTHTNEGYYMRLTPGFSDLTSFRDFLRRTAIIDHRNAHEGETHFRMYQGPLFGGKDYVWSAGVTAELAGQYASLTRMLVSFHRRSGDDAAAKKTLCAYLTHVPLDAEMNGELLQLYLAHGEQDRFRHHYARYLEQLEQELGVGPADEIKRLAEQIE